MQILFDVFRLAFTYFFSCRIFSSRIFGSVRFFIKKKSVDFYFRYSQMCDVMLLIFKPRSDKFESLSKPHLSIEIIDMDFHHFWGVLTPQIVEWTPPTLPLQADTTKGSILLCHCITKSLWGRQSIIGRRPFEDWAPPKHGNPHPW